MSKTLDLQLAVPTGSLDAYMQAVSRVSVLSAERETELANRLHNDGDLEAARELEIGRAHV